MDDIELEEAELLELAMKARSFFDVCPPPALPEGLQLAQEVDSNKLLLSVKQQITDIFLANMQEKYIAAGWGCNVQEKQKELFHRASRFVLIQRPLPTPSDGASIHKDEIAAFMMFRFTWDDEDEPDYPVLYLYELQVAPQFVRQGLGKYLLQYAMQLAEHFKMRKVVLTCLKNSTDAMAFYTKQGFHIDANSPSRGGFHNEVYEILSNKPDYR